MNLTTVADFEAAVRYHESSEYMSLQRYSYLVFAVLSDICAIFTIYVITGYSSNLFHAYKFVILFLTITPALLSTYVAVIYQPYYIFPYPVILNNGILAINPNFTIVMLYITLCLVSAILFGVLFSLSYNIILVTQINVKTKVKRLVHSFCPIYLFFLALNTATFFNGVHWSQSIESCMTSSQISLFHSYAAKILTFDRTSTLFLVYESSLGFAVTMIGAGVIVGFTFRKLHLRKQALSATLYKLHQTVSTVLVIYFVILVVSIFLPPIVIITLMLYGHASESKYPLLQLLMTPLMVINLQMGAVNLIYIEPYRKAARSIGSRVKHMFSSSSNSSQAPVTVVRYRSKSWSP